MLKIELFGCYLGDGLGMRTMKNYGIIRTLFQFHETRRWKNMFKKTLLALAVAGASISANAGQLAVKVTDGYSDFAQTPTITETGKTIDALTGNDTCLAAAKALGVTANANGNTLVAGDAETITVINSESIFDRNAVTYTSATACDVSIADTAVAADDSKYSQEGADALGLTITAVQVAGVGGFQEEDTLIFTVEGGVINETASQGATITSANGTYTLLGVVDNTILFTVTGTGIKPYEILTIEGVVVTPNDGATSVSLSSVAQNTANVQYDKSSKVEITKMAKQYSATAHVLADGVIDVQEERLEFEPANPASDDSSNKALTGLTLDTKARDTLVVKVTENTDQGNLTPSTGTLVIKGNFSWMSDLDADDNDKLSSAEIQNGFAFAAYKELTTDGALTSAGTNAVSSASLNADMTELTIKTTVGNDADINPYQAVTFIVPTSDNDATVSLEATKFLATIDFKNNTSVDGNTTAADLAVTSDLAVGEWTLNGSVVEVPYIPFGPNTQPIIRHTNTGAQTGDISVRYMVEENTAEGLAQSNEWKSLGVLVEDAKPGVRNLLKVITDALEAELGTNKFKVALEITTNVPAADVTVFAAAKVTAEGQDRLTIGAFTGENQ